MNQLQDFFAHCISYGGKAEIVVPILLTSDPATPVPVDAKLDTGSNFCVFQPDYAALLGLQLRRGTPQRMRTATGVFLAYGHEVTVTVRNIEWQATIYFAEDEHFPVNVVGRVGFLDRLRIALVDYEQVLYLSSYEDQEA